MPDSIIFSFNHFSLKIILGSRTSKLAKWQANSFIELLNEQGYNPDWKGINTRGDLDQTTPLDAFGERGVFTKAIDRAVLGGDIDVAIHSLKDCPSEIPEGLHFAAVLKRDFSEDVLVCNSDFSYQKKNIIATSSSRRKAQWLSKFPNAEIVNVRGNVDSRLEKFQASNWDGMILSRAGLERLKAMPRYIVFLDWMTPAPTQGMIAAYTLKSNEKVNQILKLIEDPDTRFAADLEREFMRIVEMKCNAPIGAHVRFLDENRLQFRAEVFDSNGKNIFSIDLILERDKAEKRIRELAFQAKQNLI